MMATRYWGEAETQATGYWGEAEVQATGWGEAETQATGWECRLENDNAGQANVGKGYSNKDEYAEDDKEDVDEEGTEEEEYDEDEDEYYYEDETDEEDAYYATIAEEETTERGTGMQVQPEKKSSVSELFRLPYELMFRGSFHGAKVHAAREDRFLVVNLQTRHGAGDFPSQLQNRDLWADELVHKVVKDSFVFFLLQKGNHSSEECSKVCSLYRIKEEQLPAVLVLDPITGQLLGKRSGAMTPDQFMECIVEYTNSKPSTLSKPNFVKKTPLSESASASAAGAVGQQPAAESSEAAAEAGEHHEPETAEDSAATAGACSEQEPVPVPEAESPAEEVDDDEPVEGEKMYMLRIRFPDGTVVAKEFGCNRRVASLFAFCRSVLHGAAVAGEKKAFRIMRFAGRGLEAIQDSGAATFHDLGLNCMAVVVVFDA
ncbi:hypothetical protein U9M48_022633 [Paspalum notatum var. saurae]|uniref:UBX domain-containing protein n=1 Tax=Paspalum notatum var. saurae TaxID=547442 RepID=A0AAQ3TM61_PASNO